MRRTSAVTPKSPGSKLRTETSPSPARKADHAPSRSTTSAFRSFTRIAEHVRLTRKGADLADETGLEHDEILNASLYPDMAALIGQVQRACDAARLTAVRVAAIEPLDIPVTEKTFDDLEARIVRTLGYLDAVPQDAMDGREDMKVVLARPDHEVTFTARDYMLSFALPNFYFHVSMAFAVLRHNGVPVSKPTSSAGAIQSRAFQG